MSAYQSPDPLFNWMQTKLNNETDPSSFVRLGREDICANRHRGNEESKAAFKIVRAGLTVKQAEVFKFIAAQGALGATTDEVSRHFNAMPNEISGRMSELKRDGKIKADGRRRLTRGGCYAAVCVIA